MVILFEMLAALFCAVVLVFSVVPYVDAVWLVAPFAVLIYLAIDRSKVVRHCMIGASKFICDKALPRSKKSVLLISILMFATILVPHIVYWLAYYPGGLNLDALGQWDQLLGITGFDDWHPVMNTLLYYCTYKLTGSFAFCIACQLTAFSIALTCLLAKLYSIGIRAGIVEAIAIFSGINPAIALCNICMTKDVYFTVAIISLITLGIGVIDSRGKSLLKPVVVLAIAFFLIMITFNRHNGILFSGPFFVLLLLFYIRMYPKKIVAVGSLFLVGFMLIKGGVYPALGVKAHENVVGESVGVPMAVMVNAFVDDPDNCPQEVKEYLLKIADEEDWKKHYYVGEWDSCKWEFGGTELLKNASLSEVLELAYRAARACPQAAYNSVVQNTRVVWQVFGPSYWTPFVYVEENEYGINREHFAVFEHIAGSVTDISHLPILRSIAWNTGLYLLSLILLTVEVFRAGKREHAMLVLPLFAYVFGTSCLLCGPSFRYFYLVLVLALPGAAFLTMYSSLEA